MNHEENNHDYESLSSQLDSVQKTISLVFGSLVTVIIAVVIGLGVVWRENGAHEMDLKSIHDILLQHASHEGRISSIESTRVTVADGRALVSEISSKVDLLRLDIANLKEDVAVLKSKEKGR